MRDSSASRRVPAVTIKSELQQPPVLQRVFSASGLQDFRAARLQYFAQRLLNFRVAFHKLQALVYGGMCGHSSPPSRDSVCFRRCLSENG